MALVKISRGADIQHNYVNGVSRVSILEGAYKDATVERISLQPGADFSAELYTREQHNQVFLITAGKGYIVTPRRVFNITEVSVFVPDFDKESVTFHCAADAKETMEIVHFVTELNDYDKTCLKEAHMSLPRFRGVSGAWHYKEDFTGADIQQMMLLEHRNLGRLSMGANFGTGPNYIGQHIHNELEQWYIMLPGATRRSTCRAATSPTPPTAPTTAASAPTARSSPMCGLSCARTVIPARSSKKWIGF